MKKINLFSIIIIALLFSACKKDETKAVLTMPATLKGFTSSASQIVLSAANDSASVVTFKWNKPDYGAEIPLSYSLQFTVPSDTTGANAWSKAKTVLITSDSLQKSFLGTDLNALAATQLGLPTGTASVIVVRLKSDIKGATTVASVYSHLVLTVTPYNAIIIYPALLVKGGNSWRTPATRTNGYLLTSVDYDSKYEGYLNLPNADGYGGDAFQLISTTDGKVYGWGGSSTTLAEGGGNCYLTPAPSYMKVNVDLSASPKATINFTPVKFFISGDDNGYSTSATPMIFNAVTNKWVATNVSLTAGKSFVFTSNGNYNISYKVNSAGKLVFAGAPNWPNYNNIPVPQTGIFTVTLDLSAGTGNYTYSIQ
jgi:starch-binding outer membrane protein SusE/F